MKEKNESLEEKENQKCALRIYHFIFYQHCGYRFTCCLFFSSSICLLIIEERRKKKVNLKKINDDHDERKLHLLCTNPRVTLSGS